MTRFSDTGFEVSDSNVEVERVDTTIGELIEAITEIALQAGKTEEEGYHLASATIESILLRKCKNKSVN